MGESSSQIDFEGSRQQQSESKNLAAAVAADLNNQMNVEQLVRKYLKLKSLIERLLDEEELNEEQLSDELDNRGYKSSYPTAADIIMPSQYKRAYLNSGEAYDRIIKGKRVNKNMFSSGLQGVWGVPGK